ncbi:MAG: CoA transferase, partial [Acidimicrobiia bacterium]|nr:CoA transferase [Acidimicrobiia bacterium]
AWFDTLPEAMGRPELRQDPRFADPLTREANRAELEAELTAWAATFERFDDFRRELEAQTPFTVAEMHSIHDLAASDFAAHRQLFATAGEGIRIPARPAAGAGIGTTGRVASRGADNRDVLHEVLGYDDTRIAALAGAGILTAAMPLS